jgi:predicted nucleic acid-binding protein
MIVFDASTLILLAKIELLDIFVSSFSGGISIPEIIRDEVCIKGREETPLFTRLIEDKKIHVSKVKADKAIRKIMDDFHIDAGEAAAIILALDEKAALVATDDRNAIRACKALKLEFTTAVAILIRAFEKNLIDKAEALTMLKKLESIARYNRTIIEEAGKLIEGGG